MNCLVVVLLGDYDYEHEDDVLDRTRWIYRSQSCGSHDRMIKRTKICVYHLDCWEYQSKYQFFMSDGAYGSIGDTFGVQREE